MHLYKKIKEKALRLSSLEITQDHIVEREIATLRREAQKFANGPLQLEVDALNPAAPAVAMFGEALRATIGHGAARPDRIIFARIPTVHGLVRVALPLSGRDALAAEFAIELEGSTPAPAFLERDVRGGWGRWMGAPGREGDEESVRLCQVLASEVALGADIEWDIALQGNFTLRLPWALQLVPLDQRRCHFLMTTGKQGLLFKNHGLGAFLEKVVLVKTLLRSLAPGEYKGPKTPGRPLFPSFNAVLMI